MFIRAPSLLDVLHGYFLHGAPRHDVPFFPPPLEKEAEIFFPPLVGSHERSKPSRESLLATPLRHARRSDSGRLAGFRPTALVRFALPTFSCWRAGSERSPRFSCLVPDQTPSRSQLAHSRPATGTNPRSLSEPRRSSVSGLKAASLSWCSALSKC